MRKYVLKNKLLFFISIFFIVISSLIGIFMAYLCEYIIDTATYKNTDMFINSVVLGIGYLILYLAANIGKEYYNAKFTKASIVDLKKDVFNKVLKKNIIDFKKEDTSKYISNLTGDIQILESEYFSSVLSLANFLFLFVFAIYALLSMNIYITLAIFVVGWIPIIISRIFLSKLSFYKENYSAMLGQFTGKIKDIFSGFDVIKSFNINKQVEKDFDDYNIKVEQSKFKGKAFLGVVSSISECSGNFMFIVTLVLGAYFCINNQMTIGELIAIVQLMNYIVNPLINTVQCVAKIQAVKPVYENMVKDEDIKEENKYISEFKFNKNLSIKNLSFKYDNVLALDNISLNIEKGKKYVIVGESGGGKSTLLKLLLRYYDDYEGEILLDNIDFNKIEPDKWFNITSIIQQNVFLFNGTIKDNIVLYKDYSDEKLNEVIRSAGLEKLIEKLENGVNTSVGENGDNLSGGEKQRISIARALIRDNSVLALDEATSSLDNNTAYSIESTILNLEDITCFVITHKLIKELLCKYDQIIAIKNGQIKGIGTFDELIEKNEYFRKLYNLSYEN
ncbi:ABC-type multidrug transport system, ATPase and permease component [Clostridium sp. DSM 8431]|uniref:ABC transporter ATP-binding protein n=1 Tax=Clostridium sp. DSM 8431 TaxID=1761781 RepID=UPI0008F4514C|nr:ABC transporter ATP-binding protein [Clostridium sp. DSM 8431]SFU51095.1 ABC-type multidrug transport system, ATPase and permease component [Clostridium sp. DSM 8431]